KRYPVSSTWTPKETAPGGRIRGIHGEAVGDHPRPGEDRRGFVSGQPPRTQPLANAIGARSESAERSGVDDAATTIPTATTPIHNRAPKRKSICGSRRTESARAH